MQQTSRQSQSKRPTQKQLAIDALRMEYARRRESNPAFSLRAFARKLQLPSGRLSEILEGKRQLTESLGREIASRLLWSPDQTEAFLTEIQSGRVDRRRKGATALPAPDGATANPRQLTADAFHLIADWYHFALLNLMETCDFESDAAWMAQRLGISTVEARLALDRLERMGLVFWQEGNVRRVPEPLTTTTDVPSSALRKSHRQTLEQTIEALEDVPVEERDITSVTMAIDPKRLPEAKKCIRDFQQRLSTFLEQGARTEVYNLNVQLVPVSKRRRST